MKPASPSLLGRFFSPAPDEGAQVTFDWREFRREYLKALPWILVFTILVHLMEISGMLIGFESTGLDTLLRLRDRDMSHQIVIVEITDEDYKNPDLFDGKSPLNPKLLVNLISRLQDYRPAVIAMDFDTESDDWCRLDSNSLPKILPPATLPSDSKTNSSPNPVLVIWAEIPDAVEKSLRLTPVLGGKLRSFTHVGIPRFPVDADGVVRRYEEEFHVSGTLADCPAKFAGNAPKTASDARARANPGNPGNLLSFSAAVIEHACKSKDFSCSSLRQDLHHPVIFNFYGDRYRFPTIQSHEFIGPDAEGSRQALKSQREALLQNKIVLVGGRYNAARDVYATPLKEMAGIELIALAIQSDLSGGGIRETQMWLDKLADIVVGSLVVLVYYYYRRRPRFAISASLIGVPIIATGFSLLIFKTAAYWFNSVPIIIGMVAHQMQHMLELSENCEELQHEVHELERKLREAQPPNQQVPALAPGSAQPKSKPQEGIGPGVDAEVAKEVKPEAKP